jgi:hypothetical protein
MPAPSGPNGSQSLDDRVRRRCDRRRSADASTEAIVSSDDRPRICSLPQSATRGSPSLTQRQDSQPADRRRGRVLPSATCRECHRSICGRSQRQGRPEPRSSTGRGMSGYRRSYPMTGLRWLRPRIWATFWASAKFQSQLVVPPDKPAPSAGVSYTRNLSVVIAHNKTLAAQPSELSVKLAQARHQRRFRLERRGGPGRIRNPKHSGRTPR